MNNNKHNPPTLPILFHALALQTLSEHEQMLVRQIDDILPQTQCGLCGHHDGCLPYAYGVVVNHETHNLCVPGGQAVTDEIFHILKPHRPTLTPKSATPSKWQTDPATNRPIAVKAIINESDCIGCTKCIPACPVDAIIGTAKHMHTIIGELCTGCELCLPPCPVDCISLVPHHAPPDDDRQSTQQHLKKRYHQHLNRVAKSVSEGTKPVVSTIESAIASATSTQSIMQIDKNTAKNAIELAKLRTQIKKLTKQLAVRENPTTRQQLNELTTKLTALSHD
ncbi:MAG: RnfABCDGE type electron transport complex subunit B [Moraxella sp.]|nr:RnfABCDGE type electron transport complex subunit B [Moraxella sp.]